MFGVEILLQGRAGIGERERGEKGWSEKEKDKRSKG